MIKSISTYTLYVDPYVAVLFYFRIDPYVAVLSYTHPSVPRNGDLYVLIVFQWYVFESSWLPWEALGP